MEKVSNALLNAFDDIYDVYMSYPVHDQEKITTCFSRNQKIILSRDFQKIPSLRLIFDSNITNFDDVEISFKNEPNFMTLMHKHNFSLPIEIVLVMPQQEINIPHFIHANSVIFRKENNKLNIIYIEPHGVFDEEYENRLLQIVNRIKPIIVNEYGLDILSYVELHYPEMLDLFVSDVSYIARYILQMMKIELPGDIEQIQNQEEKAFAKFLYKAAINKKDYLTVFHKFANPKNVYKKLLSIRKFKAIQAQVIPYLLKKYLKIDYDPKVKTYYDENRKHLNIYVHNKEYNIQGYDTQGFCSTISMISYFIDLLLSECVNDICYKELKDYKGSIYVDLFFQILHQFVYKNIEIKPFSICTDNNNYMCPFNIFYTILTINEASHPDCDYVKTILHQKVGKQMKGLYEVVNNTVNNIREIIFTQLPKKVQTQITRSLYEDILNEMY